VRDLSNAPRGEHRRPRFRTSGTSVQRPRCFLQTVRYRCFRSPQFRLPQDGNVVATSLPQESYHSSETCISSVSLLSLLGNAFPLRSPGPPLDSR
jgi:hypothetical protein